MVSRRLIQKRRVAMQGKAEKRMSQALYAAGCLLALTGYKILAICCWAAGMAWESNI